MSALPSFASRDRVSDAVLVVLCGIVQASALAVAAFATRDAFTALHTGVAPSVDALAALVASGILTALCLYLSRRRSEALGQSYANALRRTLFAHLAGLPKSRHSERRIGALSLRFVGDLSAARLWFGKGLPRCLSALVVLPGAACILIALDPLLAAAGIMPVALTLAFARSVALHLHDRHRILRSGRANLSICMIQRIAVSPELDLLGRTGRELRQLEKRGAKLRESAVARASRAGGLQALLQAGVALAGVTVLWTAGTNNVATGTTAAALSVLALLAMPLKELAEAWDQYCAWRIARGKAQNLFAETSLPRQNDPRGAAVSIVLSGQINGQSVEIDVPAGASACMTGPGSSRLAQAIAGLDPCPTVQITYNQDPCLPACTYVGDIHIGIEGSLRRTATLMCSRRPSDRRICNAMRNFGLSPLLDRLGGLDARIGEGARQLTVGETLRIDLVRAILGRAELIVIDSMRWRDDPNTAYLTNLIGKFGDATLLVVSPAPATAGIDTLETRPI